MPGPITGGLGLVAGASTWANIPAATAYPAGTQWRVTDIGSAGSIWVTDATRWYPLNGSVTLLATAIPMILPSSGTIGNNGALSGLTAFPGTYVSCYMYFPANAIAAGVAAGLYYCVMSSTTAGTIYNNTYTSGQPTIPASPTAFSTTGPGAYTQTTASDVTVLSGTVPANTLGINGELRSTFLSEMVSGASYKVIGHKLGGTSYYEFYAATNSGWGGFVGLTNRGETGKQAGPAAWYPGTSNGGFSPADYSIDTTTDKTWVATLRLHTVATDWVILRRVTLEIVTQ